MIEILKISFIVIVLFALAPAAGILLAVFVMLALVGLPIYGLIVYFGLLRDPGKKTLDS